MYKIARNATVRMIVDTIAQFDNAMYYEWDGHAESFRLPEKDLIGLVGFACTGNQPFHDVTFGIAVMTFNDPDLSRSTAIVDAFYNRLTAFARYLTFNDDGSATGFEVVLFDGVSASPMGRVDARPTVEIEATGRVTRAGQWPPQGQ